MRHGDQNNLDEAGIRGLPGGHVLEGIRGRAEQREKNIAENKNQEDEHGAPVGENLDRVEDFVANVGPVESEVSQRERARQRAEDQRNVVEKNARVLVLEELEKVDELGVSGVLQVEKG